MKMKKRIVSLLLVVLLLVSVSTTAFADVDSQPPVITEGSLSVDKTQATVGDTVTVTIEATDNVGVDRIHISLWNLNSSEQYHGRMIRIEGTDTYKFEFHVTENTPAGMWTVRSVSVYDTTANNTSFDSFDDTYGFEVVGTFDPIKINVNDISVDKTQATVGDTVTISVNISSDRVVRASISLINDTSGMNLNFLDMTFVEATQKYVYEFNVEESTPSGVWRIGFINASDKNGFGIAEWGGSAEIGFNVVGTSADNQAPVINNATLNFSENEIEHGEQSVISVQITDNELVSRVVFTISNYETGMLLAYPEMTYNTETGLYEYVFKADETIPSGHWRIGTIHAEDATGNLDLQSYFSWDYSVLVKGENDHVYETDEAVKSTCSEPGLTEGSSCKICGSVLVAQETVLPTGHIFTDKASYRIATAATCTTPATYYVQCDNCYEISKDKTVVVGDALGHNFEPNEEYCTNGCGTPNPDYVPTYNPPSVKPSEPDDDELISETPIFTDVPANAYYADAVAWAVANGITTGTDENTFSPDAPCTRAQVVTFLWRAMGSPEPRSAGTFTDVNASSYYAKAVRWALENGITSGTSATTFDPNAVCTRAQVVTFLMRALDGRSYGSAGFADVAASSYYADAVAWAVANGITDGTSATTFSPDTQCNRAQIVTFLYRAVA